MILPVTLEYINPIYATYYTEHNYYYSKYYPLKYAATAPTHALNGIQR
jgi:hypothetical protein